MKIAHHDKNQEYVKLSEKRQSIDANTEKTEMLGFFDKDFKAAVIESLQNIIMNTLESNNFILLIFIGV